jgi:hypothetical protein
MHINLKGLHRSGTNYLTQILEMNYGIWAIHEVTHGRESKHFKPISNSSLKTIVIHKNPYKWFESLALRMVVEWKKHHPQCCNAPVLGTNEVNLIESMKIYKDFYNHFYDQVPADHYMRYEDLISEDKDATVRNIGTALSVDLMHDGNIVYPKRVRVTEGNWDPSRVNYYSSTEDFKLLEREHLDQINSFLGPQFFAKLGYEMV